MKNKLGIKLAPWDDFFGINFNNQKSLEYWSLIRRLAQSLSFIFSGMGANGTVSRFLIMAIPLFFLFFNIWFSPIELSIWLREKQISDFFNWSRCYLFFFFWQIQWMLENLLVMGKEGSQTNKKYNFWYGWKISTKIFFKKKDKKKKKIDISWVQANTRWINEWPTNVWILF